MARHTGLAANAHSVHIRELCARIDTPIKQWKVDRAAECDGLENRCAATPHQGFESLTFRDSKEVRYQRRSMNYQRRAVTIRTNNSLEGMKQIGNLWTDIMNGKFTLSLPPNGTIVSRYSNYESDESGNYDLSVMGVRKEFVERLEALAQKGRFRVYKGESDDGDVAAATEQAWQRVWNDTQSGELKRAFTEDYELSEVESGSTTCTVYIALA